MPIRFVSSAITAVGGDSYVNALEASPSGFAISGTGVYEATDPTPNQIVPVRLTFSGGITQTVNAVITGFANVGGGTKTYTWTITDTTLSATSLPQDLVAVVVKFPDPGGSAAPATPSAPFGFTFDTIAPDSVSILSVTDDVVPVTGPLADGGTTDDRDLTVRVTPPSQFFGAIAGDTVQLYNGTDTTKPLGAHILTDQDFSITLLAFRRACSRTATLTSQSG